MPQNWSTHMRKLSPPEVATAQGRPWVGRAHVESPQVRCSLPGSPPCCWELLKKDLHDSSAPLPESMRQSLSLPMWLAWVLRVLPRKTSGRAPSPLWGGLVYSETHPISLESSLGQAAPLPLAFQNWDPLVALPVNSHSRIVIRLWLCALIFEKQGPVHIVNLRRPHGSFIPVGRYVSAFLFWLTFWAVCIIFYKTELKKQWLLTGGFRKPRRL